MFLFDIWSAVGTSPKTQVSMGGWGFMLCHGIAEAVPVAPGESWRRGASGFARSLGLEWF